MKPETAHRDSLIRRVLVLVGGAASGQLIVLAASPLLTRLYTPDQFGYLALYASLVSTFVVIASLRYHLAIPLPVSHRDGFALTLASLAIVFTTTSILTLGLFTFHPWILTWFGAQELEPYLWFVPLGLLGAGTYQVLSSWAIRHHAYRPLARTKAVQGATLAGAQLVLGVFGAGAVGLMIGDVLGRAAGSGILLRKALARGTVHLHRTMLRARRTLARYRKFPRISAPSALFNAAGMQLPAILLLALYGPQVAGWYALTQRVVAAPLALLGTSMSQVYTGAFASQRREASGTLQPLFRAAALRLMFVALPIAVLLAAFGTPLFTLVFSETWREAGGYAQRLAPMLAVQFIASPLSQTLSLLERQGSQLLWDAGRLAAVIGVFVIAERQNLAPTETILILSLTLAAAYLILIVASWWALKSADGTTLPSSEAGRDAR